MLRNSALAVAALLSVTACDESGGGSGAGRDYITAVGSSTVFPFATAVAEQFADKNQGSKSPVIESTGTGAGFKLFCAGVGPSHPDVENASRRIKRSEYDDCVKNGVNQIVEVQIGLDGIAFAETARGLKLNLTTPDIYEALAANPYGKPQTAKTWRDVNPAFPAVPIKVYGPPSTSGTRDALAELILTKGCESNPAMVALKASDADEHKRICTTVREDGAFVDSGENDNLIVQKIESDPRAVGVFGFSFLEENASRLKGSSIDGVAPTYAAITDFSYPGARPLYIYVKSAHLNVIPGLKDYVTEFASAWGPDGYLRRRGMVVAPENVRAQAAAAVASMKAMDPAGLQ